MNWKSKAHGPETEIKTPAPAVAAGRTAGMGLDDLLVFEVDLQERLAADRRVRLDHSE